MSDQRAELMGNRINELLSDKGWKLHELSSKLEELGVTRGHSISHLSAVSKGASFPGPGLVSKLDEVFRQNGTLISFYRNVRDSEGDIRTSETLALKPATLSELSQDFFERDTTETLIEDLTGIDNLTLFAGAGVSADTGAPLPATLVTTLLANVLKQHYVGGVLWPIDELPAAKERELLVAATAAALAEQYSSVYLASILRASVDQEHDSAITDAVKELTDGRNKPGGFLARAVGSLAFAAASSAVSDSSVQILTTNPNSGIQDQTNKIFEYYGPLDEAIEGFTFQPCLPNNDDWDEDKQVPVFHLNGLLGDKGSPDSLVLGESDILRSGTSWRSNVLANALSKTESIFVGTAITDLDIMAHLASTNGTDTPARYAILVAPDKYECEPSLVESASELTEGDEEEYEETLLKLRQLLRNMVAQRFAHLGVFPVIVEYPYQVVQLLNEITLRRLQDDYRPYRDRQDEWWHTPVENPFEDASKKEPRARFFGFKPGDDDTKFSVPSTREVPRMLEAWKAWLSYLRNEVRNTLDDAVKEKKKAKKLRKTLPPESLIVEMWIWNPDSQQLLQWATSEGTWDHSDTAHLVSLDGHSYMVQEAFRQGSTITGTIGRKRSRWRYHLTVPIRLHRSPWLHLPVGVVSILSTEAEGALHSVVSSGGETFRDMESSLKAGVREILDPDEEALEHIHEVTGLLDFVEHA